MGILFLIAFLMTIFSLTFLSLSRHHQFLSEKKTLTLEMNAVWLTPRKKEVNSLYNSKNGSTKD